MSLMAFFNFDTSFFCFFLGRFLFNNEDLFLNVIAIEYPQLNLIDIYAYWLGKNVRLRIILD